VGDGPAGIAITPDGQFAYVANRDDNTVSVIETFSYIVSDTVHVGDAPIDLVITPDGQFAYVMNIDDGTVSVIRTDNNMVIETVNVGNAPVDVVITPDGQFAYVTNFSDSSVSVIEIASNTVVTTVNVGNAPVGIAITPDGQFAYVANRDDNTVSVIETASNTVTDDVNVGSQPTLIAITLTPTAIESVEGEAPTVFTLEQNYPNPFNLSTNIKYGVAKSDYVKLAVYNLIGEEVSVLVNGHVDAGFYEIEFNAAYLPSGIYFSKLQAGDFIETKKMVLLR